MSSSEQSSSDLTTPMETEESDESSDIVQSATLALPGISVNDVELGKNIDGSRYQKLRKTSNKSLSIISD